MRARSTLAALLGMLTLFPGWSGADPIPGPSKAEVQEIERSVVLPHGAEPVEAFVRYYAAVSRNGHRIIRGIYVLGEEARIVMTTAERLPMVLDGGCGVVTVEFDASARAFLETSCNGEA